MSTELPINDRLQHLESILASLEHQYDQLNRVVIEQGKLLARLQGEHQQTAESLRTIELERVRATNPKPPHYQ